MTMIKRVVAFAALSCLTACEKYVERVDFSKERADRQYREAMAAYSVGQLGTAVSKLKEVCRDDPANASARFQLACILQENERDYLGAYCAFREYVSQHPNSDKAKLAESRMAVCERALGTVLADKYGLNVSETQRKETEEVLAKLKKADVLKNKLSKDVEALMRRVTSLNEENERLKNLMRERNTSEDAEAPKDEIAAARDLIIEDDSAKVTAEETAAAKELAFEEVTETPQEDIAEGKSLLDAVAEEQATPMLTQSSDAHEKRKATEAARDAMHAHHAALAAEERSKRESRPSHYVVQEGDTLYKIAERFYGRTSAWQQIREANKAIVSPDGRIKVGQKLTLP